MGMMGAKHNFKVLNCIVALIAIFVMDNFAFANGTPKVLCHYQPVFENALSIDVDHLVTVMERSLSSRSSALVERASMTEIPGVVLEAESVAVDSGAAFLDNAHVGSLMADKSSGCRVLHHSVRKHSDILPQQQMVVKRNRSAKWVNSVEPLTGHAEGNTEPSRRYIDGRCNDYRRGLTPLITGKNAHRESDDIVYSPWKLGVQRVVGVTDGNAITAAKSGSAAGLFVGINDASLADSAYGRIQVYGFRTSAWVSAASAGNTPGTFLRHQGAQFKDMTMSAATTSGHTHVVLMETVAAAGAGSVLAQYNVFVRAL